MKRPAFQFYPGDWKANANLRRCSEAARGAWMDVLCVLHDSDEYGVIRWPLSDIARTAGVPLKLLKELSQKKVLKGGDTQCDAFIFTPRHANKDGEPVELLPACIGPCWYSSRFVRDEHVRQRRGVGSQFSGDNQPPKATPKGGIGDSLGDGSSSSSSSSLEDDIKARARQAEEIVNAYPRREKFQSALIAVSEAIRRGDDPAKILAATKACAVVIRSRPNAEFVPSAGRFFEEKRWKDDPEVFRQRIITSPKPATRTADDRNKTSAANLGI